MQGFKIASAWVEINADTSGLRRDAQDGVRRALAGIDARIRLNADSTGLRAQVRAAAKKAGAGESATIKIKTDFNVAEARAKMMAGIKGLNLNADVDINPDIDATLMRAKIKTEVDALKGRFSVPVTPDINTSLFAAKLQAAARLVSGTGADIPIDLNPNINRLKLRAEVGAAAAAVRASITFNADLKEGMLDAQIAAAKARLDAMGRNLTFRAKVDVDTTRARAELALLNKDLDSSGTHIGRWTKIVMAIGALGPPAIAALLPAIEAVGTGSLGLIPAFSELALVFGTVAVGGNGVVNAITASTKGAKQFAEAMDKLTPSAQDFVEAIITEKGAFHDLQQSVQNTLFDGLDDSFRAMAHNTIPDLTIGLGGMAMQLNDMAKLSMTSITNLSRMGLLKTMFGGLQIAMDPLVPMPGQILANLTRLTIAATPLFIRMTQSMGRGMDDLTAKITRLFDSGQLQAKISGAGDTIVNFFKNIGNNPEWQTFVSRMQNTGPQMARALTDIAEALLKVVNDAGPLAGVLIQGAAAFSRLVSSLPSGFVTTLMSLYLGMKLIGVAGKILGVVAGFVGKLFTALKLLASQQAMVAAIGPALTKIGASAGVISKTAVAVRALGIAVGVLLVGKALIDHFSSSAVAAAPNVDKLKTSLGELAKSGNFGGELKKTFGDIGGITEGINTLNKGIKANIGGWEHLMGGTAISDWTRKVIDNAEHGGKSVESWGKKVGGLDKSLASLVSDGYANVAAAAVQKLGISGKDSEKWLKDYNQALLDQQTANKLAAISMGTFGDRAVATQGHLKALDDSVKGLTDSLFAMNNVNRDASEATRQYEQAADDAVSAAKQYAGVLDMQNGRLVQNTQAQRDAAEKADQLAAASEANGLAIYKQTGDWNQAQAAWKEGRSTLEKVLTTMGLSKTQAQQYAAEILKIPTQKEINLQLKSDAQQQLASIAAAFRAAPDKKSINVDVLDAPAIAILKSLGLQVTQLPDGTFQVTAKTAGAKDSLDKIDKYKVSDKDVSVTADTRNAITGLQAVQTEVKKTPGAKSVTVKTLNATAIAALEAVGLKTRQLPDGKTQVYTANGQALGSISAVRNALNSLNGKTARTWTYHTVTTTYVSDVVKHTGQSAHDAVGARGGIATPFGIKRYATGGGVSGLLQGPGTKTSDSILARLSKGEFVMRAAAVDKYGPEFMQLINSGWYPKLPRFSVGGYTKTRSVGKGTAKHTEYFYQGQWLTKDQYDKAHGAATQLEGLTTFSSFGKMAQAQGSFKNNEIENALGNSGSISNLVDSLNQYKNLIATSTSGKTETNLLNQLNSSGKALLANEKKYEAVNKALDTAKTNLDNLKSSFDDLKTSVASSIVSFGNITKAGKYGTSVSTLISQLQSDTGQAQQFNSMLSQLKAKGLNSQALSDIAEAGISGGGMATAQTLLGASAADIKKINDLQTQLTAAANSAGTTVADSMYGAGIKAAQGLVDGLTSQQAAIEATMMSIAKSMEAAIKKALGIKSPSRVMMGLGSHVAEGFALGIEQNDRPKTASMAMANKAPTAVTSTTTSMGGGVVINGGITVQVSGTFDLTNAQQRKDIANSLAGEIVKATRQYDRARS
ncbi:hypothetical protein [Streptomyces sp. NPDC088847]|uniref:hypothetical protein n=1 Tax=Streptomyces sp. NPDC088847 TaxID=3365909 RepID=UPI00382446B2